jgi:polyhydroxybutyrate depolymerase
MRSIDVDGSERSFWLPDRRPRGDARLIIALHGRSETGLKLARRTGLYKDATAAGFNIVFPDALERVWDDHGAGRRDGADDDRFITVLLEHLHRRGEFDGQPPLVLGDNENGACFAERLAREGVHRLGGVVLNGGTARQASRALTPQPVHPVPLLIANPPAAGRRRPGLRTRLALADVRGNALIDVDTLLDDWRAVNDPAGVHIEPVPGAPGVWELLTRLRITLV